jgi:hypothetical protein
MTSVAELWLVAQLQFEMVCERPPRSLRSRLPLTRGRLRWNLQAVYSPPREGESRRRRQGVGHTPSRIGAGQHGFKKKRIPWICF